MAINISGLVNNISESIKSFARNFSDREASDFGKITNRVDPANWIKSLPYAFAVFENGRKTESFTLPINPTDINQDDTPAIKITPTQKGTVVNHSGIKYGKLTISGTTGVTPYKGAGGVRKSTGEAIFQASTGAHDDKYKSGYEIFLNLRNWFKLLYEEKAAGIYKDRTVNIVFQNFKDGEFLIVELINFGMRRTSTAPLQYSYDLEFRILGREEFVEDTVDSLLATLDNNLNKAQEYIDTARGVFLRSSEILQQIEAQYEEVVVETLRKGALAVKAAIGVPLTLADVGKKALQNTLSAAQAFKIVLNTKDERDSALNLDQSDFRDSTENIEIPDNPVESDAKAILLDFDDALLAIDTSNLPEKTINSVTEDQNSALDLPKSFYRDAIEEFKRIRDNASDNFGLTSSTYDSFYERTQTFTPTTTKEPTTEEFEVLKAFSDAVRGFKLVVSSKDLFKSTFDEQISSVLEKFNNEIDLRSKIATREYKVQSNSTLERIAANELGDSVRWIEIAELNNLKYPYIVDENEITAENSVQIVSKRFTDPTAISGLAVGDKHIVAASAVGGWVGQDAKIATYKGGTVSDPASWVFTEAPNELVVYVIDEEKFYEKETSSWAEYTVVSYTNVVRPGENILLPQDPQFGFSELQTIDDLAVYEGMTEQEKFFGIDLKLDENFDLTLTGNGDVGIVKGVDNVAQAIRVLLSIKKGDLLKHPQVGTQLQIGSKVPSLNDVRTEIVKSLVQDPRFENIANLELLNNNNVISISFSLKLKNVDRPVPVIIKV